MRNFSQVDFQGTPYPLFGAPGCFLSAFLNETGAAHLYQFGCLFGAGSQNYTKLRATCPVKRFMLLVELGDLCPTAFRLVPTLEAHRHIAFFPTCVARLLVPDRVMNALLGEWSPCSKGHVETNKYGARPGGALLWMEPRSELP